MKNLINILTVFLSFQSLGQVPGIVICKDSVMVYNKPNTDTNLYIQYLNQEIEQRWRIQVLESKLNGVYNYSNIIDSIQMESNRLYESKDSLLKSKIKLCEFTQGELYKESLLWNQKYNRELITVRKIKNQRNTLGVISGLLISSITLTLILK